MATSPPLTASFSDCSSVAGQGHAPEAEFGQFVERAGDIDHGEIGHDVERSGRGFGQHARFRRGMAVLHDDGRDAEGGCRAQDGADIVRIGNLVEHQHDAAALGGDQDIGDIALGQGLALQGRALMHGPGRKQPADRVRIGDFVGHAGEQLAADLCGGALGQHGAMGRAGRIGEGRLHGVQTIEPQARRAGFRRRAAVETFGV